jgi:hypothetical protein
VYVLQKQGRHPPLEKSEVVLQKVVSRVKAESMALAPVVLLLPPILHP